MFSPYYAAARRRGTADPEDYCAFNVALYGERTKHWAMTERRKSSLQRSESALGIGPSQVTWDGTRLSIDINERAVPRMTPIRGRVDLYPGAITSCQVAIDGRGVHRWWPIAPRSRVEVKMEQPALSWSGSGYFDTNNGDRPLEQDFARWTWARADSSDGATVLYDVICRNDDPVSVALRVDSRGQHESFIAPPEMALPASKWRIDRRTRTEQADMTEVLRTFEDTPFYARSEVRTHLFGRPHVAMHESLSLDRFSSRVVQLMLPFRMPRSWR